MPCARAVKSNEPGTRLNLENRIGLDFPLTYPQSRWKAPGKWKHLWHNMAQQSNWMLLILCKLLCDFCHCPVAQPVSSWVESFDHVMQVTPSLWAFSYRRTHWPVATRQTLICPSWEPLASSSESLLKATAMTAFSCIIKLPAAHPGTSTSNESTNQA